MSKERKLNEAEFRKVVRAMVQTTIKEQATRKASQKPSKPKAAAIKESAQPEKPKGAKLSVAQLREMVQDTVLETLEEELDRMLEKKKKTK
jgi:hypothetical protein